MATKSVKQTTYFDVQYDDSTGDDGLAVANAVLDVCEADLAKLNLYMPSADKYRDLKIRVLVLNDLQNGPPYGFAENYGYTRGVQSEIQINPFGAKDVAVTPDGAAYLFVLELAELLMTFWGWDAGSSQGEALSRLMGEELHPAAAGNSVDPWTLLPSPRPDWISQNKTTPPTLPGEPPPFVRGDTDPIPIGCAIIFIYFLRYQLGKSYQEICQNPAPLLLNRYQALTGLTDDPVARVDALLDKHYGKGGFTLGGSRNNPFPLLDGADRKLALDFGPLCFKTTLIPGQRPAGTAHIRPLFFCPVGDYPYVEYGNIVTQRITASSIGIAVPEFVWKINGERLFARDEVSTASVKCPVDVPNPQDPGQPVSETQVFSFNYQITEPDELSSVLTITTQSFGGDYHPTLSVDVDESRFPSEPVVASQTLTFSTRSVVYGGTYDSDRQNCERSFLKSISHLVHIQNPLSALLGPKGDPPRGDLSGVVAAIDEIRAQLAHLAVADPGTAAKIARYAEQKLGLAPHVLLKRASGAQG